MGQREKRAKSLVIEFLLANDDGDAQKAAAIVQQARDELGADAFPMALVSLATEGLKQIHGERWREHLQLVRHEDELGEIDG